MHFNVHVRLLTALAFTAFIPATALAINCELVLVGRADNSTEMGLSAGDKAGDAIIPYRDGFAAKAFNVPIIHVLSRMGIRKVHLAPALADKLLIDLNDDASFALLEGRSREYSLVNLRNGQAEMQFPRSEDNGFPQYQLAGKHTLVEINSRTSEVKLMDLARPSQYSRTAPLPDVGLVKSDVMEAMGFAEDIKWQANYNELTGILYLAPLGEVINPTVTRYSVIGPHLRRGPSFKFPVFAGDPRPSPRNVTRSEAQRGSLANRRRIPPELVEILLNMPHFYRYPHEVTGVRFDTPSTMDVLTSSTVPNSHMTSTLQSFSLIEGRRQLNLDLLAGHRASEFAFNPSRNLLAVATEQFLSDDDRTKRKNFILIVKLEGSKGRVIQAADLAKVFTPGESLLGPYVIQLSWKADDQLVVTSNRLNSQTFRVELDAPELPKR